ncbi:hypothetical protein, partial [Bradyrhizobium sp.]|uniref:hypothetical protein n=4 Tax=Bradyrhizobium sp. TaxID=376 RepID=UPI003C7CD582
HGPPRISDLVPTAYTLRAPVTIVPVAPAEKVRNDAARGAVMKALAGVLFVGGWLLGLGIYLLTLYIAYLTGFVPMLLTLIFPFLAQIYWIFHLWSITGVFFHTLTVLCIVWVLVMLAGAGAAAAAKDESSRHSHLLPKLKEREARSA